MADERKKPTEETEKDKKNEAKADSLDALMLDEEDEDYGETSDEAEFDTFMAEFHELMGRKLSEAASTPPEEVEEENPEEVLITLPKHHDKRRGDRREKKPTHSDDWDEKITLAPEEYDEPDEEEIREDIPDETAPDFNLGDEGEALDDGFQIAMSFGPTPEGLSEEDSDGDEEPADRVYDPDKPRVMDWVFDIAEMFVFVLLAVILLTSFVFRHSIVEGDSMNMTLEDGDHLIISDLFYTPDYGDIIVFEDYTTSLHKAVVKRVIALPGDTVEVSLDGEGNVIVYLNGQLVEEDYAYNAKDVDIDTSSFNRPITLGEGEIFVMGDNRYHSLDSRSFSVGPIDTDAILGRVVIRFFPFDKFGVVD